MCGTVVVSCLSGTLLDAWSLNPFNWIKNKNPKQYQEKVEDILEKLENQYIEPMNLIGLCEMNLQTEDFAKQIAELQKTIVVYITENHEKESVISHRKGGLGHAYRNYPCINYRKQLSDNINSLDNTVKEYKKHTNKKNQNDILLNRAGILLINLTVLNELIIKSPEFFDESTDYANKYAWHNNQLSDISSLTQKRTNTKVTASIS